MSDTSPKKVSLNQLPDTEKFAKIVQRAEEHQKTKSASSANHSDLPSDMQVEHPGAVFPPADWPIERKLLHGKIVAVLKTVYDPEIPVDVYELGLIYHIDIDAERKVKVQMTLTSPGCPVAGTLPREVEAKVEAIDEVTDATVEIVWDPPWTQARMSEAALLELGFD